MHVYCFLSNSLFANALQRTYSNVQAIESILCFCHIKFNFVLLIFLVTFCSLIGILFIKGIFVSMFKSSLIKLKVSKYLCVDRIRKHANMKHFFSFLCRLFIVLYR